MESLKILLKFKELNSNIDNLIAVVGPCIGKESYEVKTDFYERFVSQNLGIKSFLKKFLMKDIFLT